MNSYTSNSRFYAKLVLIPIMLVIAYGVMGFALDFLVLRRTTTKMYTRLPDSKVKHMNLNHKSGELDVIFLGSSRTEYHMSQKSFADNGMRVYNLGFSGAKLSSYASLLNEAMEATPKKIVLSLSVQTLFREDWKIPTTTDVASFSALREAGAGLFTQAKALWRLLEGTNRLRIYADAITGRVKSAYKKFEPKKAKKSQASKPKTALPFDDTECILAQGGTESIKCTNGDSILNGNKLKTDDLAEAETLVNLNHAKIKYLNDLSKRAADRNIEFLIVLEPTYYTKYTYDFDKIKKALKSQVFDNTSMYSDASIFWFDAGHLRYEGKKKYSDHLAQQLK